MDPKTLKKNIEVTSRIEQSNMKMYGGRIKSIMEQMKNTLYQSKYNECKDMIKETEPLIEKQQKALEEIEKLLIDTEYTITTSQQKKMKQKLEKWKEEEEKNKIEIDEEEEEKNKTKQKSIWRTTGDEQEQTMTRASIVNAPRISLIVYMANRWLTRSPILQQHYLVNQQYRFTLNQVESEESLADLEANGEYEYPPGTISPSPSTPTESSTAYDSDLLIFPEYTDTDDTESDIGEETVQAVADALISTNQVSRNEAAVIMINSKIIEQEESQQQQQQQEQQEEKKKEFPFLQDPIYVKDYVDLVHMLRGKRKNMDDMKQAIKDNLEAMINLKEKIGQCDTFEKTHGRHHMVDWYFDRINTEIDDILEDNNAVLDKFAQFVLAFA